MSQQTGYARNASESSYPNLWRGLDLWLCPSINPRGGSTVFDLGPYQRHASILNATNANWVIGKNNGSLDFDGTNDYVSSPNTTVYASGTEIAVSGWFQRDISGSFFELVAKYATPNLITSNEDGWLLRWSNTNVIRWTIANNATYHAYSCLSANTSTEWVHIAVNHKFGGGSDTQLFVNGMLQSASWSGGAGTVIPDSSSLSYPINLGVQRYNNASLNLFNGKMDDIRVYRRMLSAGEVALLASRRGIGLERSFKRKSREDVAGFANPVLFYNHYLNQGFF